jgi:hypothetical protein
MFVLPTFALGVIATITESVFNVDTDTESNILASSPTNPTGEVTVKFGTDTYDIYIWDGSAWYIYNNDYTP